MAGCSIVFILSGILAIGLAILAAFSVFAAIFVLAVVISCIQYLNRENRHRRGKKLGGWIGTTYRPLRHQHPAACTDSSDVPPVVLLMPHNMQHKSAGTLDMERAGTLFAQVDMSEKLSSHSLNPTCVP